MIDITNTEVHGFEAAIRGMRNPKNSWELSDSKFGRIMCTDAVIGSNDLKLMKSLVKAGTDHSKFMRYIVVTCDIVAPQFWWMEYDTYKVNTVRNSCSKMHKLDSKELELADFTTDGLDEVGGIVKSYFERTLVVLEDLRLQYKESLDRKYWRALLELLPTGYNMRATVQMNYQTLRNMYHARKNHKLAEWHTFCEWVETLPYSELISM